MQLLSAVRAMAVLCAGMTPVAFSGAAHGQAAYPNKQVTIVTAFPAGSGPDAVLRHMSEKLYKLWNQPVVVVNRPGGGGFVAIEATQRAPADGYTLLQIDSDHIAALPNLYKSKGFVTLNAFDPVAPIFKTYFFVAVPATSKWQNMKDLIAAAKAEPGKISYGSWGVGSPGHLGGEYLEELANVEMTHVAYKETAQLFSSVGAGDVNWSFGSIPSSQGVFKAGKLRYIAIGAPKRAPQMPEVPTMAEAGGPPQLDVNAFVVLVAPKGIPRDIQAKIHADVVKVLNEPDMKERLNAFAFEPIAWSVDEIRAQSEVKYKIYEQLVKRKNIKLD